jgi:Transposase DDE domain
MDENGLACQGMGVKHHSLGKEAKMLGSFRAAVQTARRHEGLYFAALLSEESILATFGEARALWHGWVYTPAVTVWVFLSQCLSMDHSCREAVARLSAWRVALGRKPCSADTGAYCTARDDLRESTSLKLVRQTGADLEREAPADWLWKGRHVRVVDGSTLTMPDTPANQSDYPQPASQAKGCGFPIARIVVVFSLAVGTVLDAAIGKYEGKQTGENSMFRTLYDSLGDGDVVLADRYFSGWFDLALLLSRGIDVVVRKHQLRATDFRKGPRFGKEDHLVCWHKPDRPQWMSPKVYANLPQELVLREVRVHVAQKGFRTRQLDVVTTLVDAETYLSRDIGELYRLRWQAELHLRSLKTVLQMDHLRCKTPHRVRNEFYMHLLGYNLIRRVMALAALHADARPWQVSFKATLQVLNSFLPTICSDATRDAWCEALLTAIAAHVVDDRPDRYEPRLTKRRPKKYKHFREPRANYKRRAA